MVWPVLRLDRRGGVRAAALRTAGIIESARRSLSFLRSRWGCSSKSPASMPLMPRRARRIRAAPGGREISRRSEMSPRWGEGETGRSVLDGQAKVRPVLTHLALGMLGMAVVL
jgi:hypothetical protein